MKILIQETSTLNTKTTVVAEEHMKYNAT